MNSITVCGNLTRDPELKYTQAGKPFVSFGIADNRGRDKTIFFDCTAYDDVAQRIVRFFKKGKPIFVTGAFDTREYTGRDGVQKIALQVTVTSWDFVSVGGRGPDEENGGGTRRPAPAQRETASYGNADIPPEAPGDMPEIYDPFADE